MQPNPHMQMNGLMRRAGNRSRALPNIGQTPAVQAANVVMGVQATGGAQQAMAAPGAANAAPAPATATPSPYAAPPGAQPFALNPPGEPSDPNQYNYEPQPNGAWTVYPPGVQAPPHNPQASLPRAASTGDYRRLAEAFKTQPQFSAQPQAAAPPPAPLV